MHAAPFLVLAVLLWIHAIVNARAHEQQDGVKLCVPDQCEFTMRIAGKSGEPKSEVKTTVQRMSYDKKGQRLAAIISEPWSFHYINLVKENIAIAYNLTSKTCDVMNASKWVDYCIPDGAKELDTYFIDRDQKQLVTDYKAGAFIIGVIRGWAPLYMIDIEEPGTVFYEYQNFTVGIKDAHVFDIPTACKKVKMTSRTKLDLGKKPFSPGWF